MILDLPGLAAKLEQAVQKFTDIAVVGISGGVDSAVVASIACAALGADHVFVVSMPYDETDRQTFNSRSGELAGKLGAKHLIVEIGTATDSLLLALQSPSNAKVGTSVELHRLTLGNTRSRMRMATLYALAGELSYRAHEQLYAPGAESVVDKGVPLRVRVLGTGNASEDLIGYDTKGGDALADLFVIGDLFKSEIYQLARHYAVPKSILEAPPSAGLYQGQTDAEELGYGYDALEPALRVLHQLLAKNTPDAEIRANRAEFKAVEAEHAAFVVQRFLANAHKHRAPAVVQVRSSGLVD